jgi:hypothetical protein
LNLPSDKVTKIIQSVENGKTLTSVLCENELLNKGERQKMPTYKNDEIQEYNSYRNKFARFKKNNTQQEKTNIRFPWDNRSKEGFEKPKNNTKTALADKVNELTAGKIEINDFESFLIEKNINPRAESISKHLRSAKYGNINHKSLMCSILNYKDV